MRFYSFVFVKEGFAMPKLAPSASPAFLAALFSGVVFLLPVLGGGNFPGLLGGAQNQLLWQALLLLVWGLTVMKTEESLFVGLDRRRRLWPLVGLLVVLACALPFSKPFDSAWRASFELLGGLFSAFVLLRLKPDGDGRRTLLWAFFSGMVLAALYGVYQTYLYFPSLAQVPGLSAEDKILASQMTRPFSFFPGVNVFGCFLALSFPIGAYLAAGAAPKRRIYYYLSFALLLFALVLTFSRGAWLAAVFGAFLIAYTFLGRRGRIALGVLAVLGLFGLSALMADPAPLEKAASSVVEAAATGAGEARLSGKLSLATRQQYWATAWHMGADLFPFGGGLGSYADRARQYQTSTSYTRSAHNVVLKLYAELGLLGLALGLWFAATALMAFWQARKSERAREAALIGAALLVLLAHGLIDIDFDTPAPWAVFWLLWMLLVAPGLAAPVFAAKTKEAQERRAAKATLYAALLVPAILFAQFFPKMSDAYGELVESAKKTSSYEKSLELAKQAATYWTFDARVHQRLSRLYLDRSGVSGSRDDLRLAREEIERAAELDPFSPEITLAYADVLSALGDFERTNRVLKHACELYPASLHYATQYARALSFNGKQREALYVLGKSMTTLEPLYLENHSVDGMDLLDAHFLHAAILNEQKDYASARREYLAILRLLDDPRLVLYSYVGKRDRAQSAEEIKNVARDHIRRIDEGRTTPDEEKDDGPVTLPKDIPIEKAMHKHIESQEGHGHEHGAAGDHPQDAAPQAPDGVPRNPAAR